MGHIHSVYDTDPHFTIDPITRAITNQSNEKTVIIQNDHNSERFTFEIHRHIDGHDMYECNKVQVHYINISTTNTERNSGLYEVTDLQLSPADENVVICSWLISKNATALVGTLNFIVRFACMSGNKVDYAWHTAVHSGITVATGIDNAPEVESSYPDVLETWYLELISAGSTGVNVVAQATDECKEQAINEINQAKNEAVEGANAAITEHGNSVVESVADEALALIASGEKSFATTDYVDGKVADLVDSSPETLNTLKELAKALGDDPNFAVTIANQMGQITNSVTTEAKTLHIVSFDPETGMLVTKSSDYVESEV